MRNRNRNKAIQSAGRNVLVRRAGRTQNRRVVWAAPLVAVAVTLIGAFPGPAFADDSVRQTCVGVATSPPHVDRADMRVQGRYKGIYSYFDSEMIKGRVDPLPTECTGLYGRTLTFALEIQDATNHAAWLQRSESFLVMQPDPDPRNPLAGDTFSLSSTTTGISELYGAHYLDCLKHPPCGYHRSKRQLEEGAWNAVRKYRLYVCSGRTLRPPFLRGRKSTPGATRARIRFNARAIDLNTHRTLAKRTFTRPLTVHGAC